jgi:hypothetical protein
VIEVLGSSQDRCAHRWIPPTFTGYVDFWLLDDLVDADGRVKLFLPSEDFTLPSIPRSLDDYLAFCERTIEFVTARNERIRQLAL